MFFKTFPRYGQPSPAALVDWSNPLTYGMSFCYLPGMRSDNLDLIGRRAATTVGTSVPLSAGPGGYSYQFNSSVGFCQSFPRDANVETSNVTFAYFGRATGTTARVPFCKTYQNAGTSVTYSWGVTWTTNTTPSMSFATSSTVSTTIATTKNPNALNPHVLMGTLTGTAASFYSNGVLDNTGTLAGPIVYDTTTTGNIIIGGRQSNATTNSWNGDIYLACIWNRALNVDEAKKFADNPWQIFLSTPEKNFPVTSAILSGTQGDTIRTIDRVGVKTEVVKLDIGGSATEAIVGPATKSTSYPTGLPVQHLKDAGRTPVVYTLGASAGTDPTGIQPNVSSAPAAQPASPLTGFALNNVIAVRGTTVSSGGTTKVITSGKTLRIESITLSYIPTTTVGYMRVDLRWDPNQSPTTSSPIVCSWTVGTPANGASNNSCPWELHFPDGLELPGGGAIAISTVELQAANSTSANAATYYTVATGAWAIAVTINGFEY